VYHAFGFQFLLRNSCPLHHIGDELLHIHNGRDEKRLLNHCVNPGIHTEECADAVGNQDDVLVICFQFSYRSADFSPGFPRRKGLIIQAEDLTAGKQRPVMLTLRPAAAFAVYVDASFIGSSHSLSSADAEPFRKHLLFSSV
jgi:hypothetical protein